MSTPAEKMVPELLPCPFCGNAATLKEATGLVSCENRGADGKPTCPAILGSLKRWNTRTPIPSSAVVLPREAVEKIREALRRAALLLGPEHRAAYAEVMEAAALLPPTGAGVGE